MDTSTIMLKLGIAHHKYGNQSKCVNRLVKEWEEHGKLIVAFDFDNTIYDYHGEGIKLDMVIELLKKCSDQGHHMVLFTCEEKDSDIGWKVKHCVDLGIRVDFLNSSPIFESSKKPYYNILLDDRAGLESAFNILDRTIFEITWNIVRKEVDYYIQKYKEGPTKEIIEEVKIKSSEHDNPNVLMYWKEMFRLEKIEINGWNRLDGKDVSDRQK